MLVRHDPFHQLDRVTEELWRPVRRGHWMPMDAVRHAGSVELRFDLPGVAPDAVDLTVERQVLTVTADRSWAPAEGDELLTRERPQGPVTRRVTLGESLDTDRLEARYEHGVLIVTIPVAEQAKARKVEVHVGSAPEAIEVASDN